MGNDRQRAYIVPMVRDHVAPRNGPDERHDRPSGDGRRPLAQHPLGSLWQVGLFTVSTAVFVVLCFGAATGRSGVDPQTTIDWVFASVMFAAVLLNASRLTLNLLVRYRPDSPSIARFRFVLWPPELPPTSGWESVTRP